MMLSLASAGCYTQLATRDSSRDDENEQQYAASDTTGSAAESPFFVYDDYRYMRYNMSFHYYHPGRWSYDVGAYYDPYYGGIYDPWYADTWYWPYGWRPYVMWPYPTWNAYGGYYGNHHGGYYGGYYGGHNGGGNHGGYTEGFNRAPLRQRTTGATRGTDSRGMRTPYSGSSGASQVSGAVTPGIRTRGPEQQPATPQQNEATRTSTTRGRANETAWWERNRQQDASSTQTQSVPAQPTRTQPTQPAGNGERRTRQANQSGTQTQTTQGTSPRTGTTAAPADHPRRERSSGTSNAGQGRTTQVAPSSQGRGSSAPASSGGGGGRSGGSSGGSSSGGGSRQRER